MDVLMLGQTARWLQALARSALPNSQLFQQSTTAVGGAKSSHRSRHADTALLEACRKGDLRRVEAMWPLAKLPRETFKSVVRREGPDCVDGPPVPEFEQFENVLHAACAGGHLDVIKYLVEKQHMFLDTCDALGRSPLKIACDGGHTACAKVLGASYPSIVNLADRDGQTPFHVACSKGNAELAELLHRYGADLNTPSTQWLQGAM